MALPDFLPGRFALARGRPSDYFALEHFHYLPQRPATYADVWVVRYDDKAHAGGMMMPPQAAALTVTKALNFADHDPRESCWRGAQRRDVDDHDAWRVVAVGVLSFPGFRSLPRERVLNLLDRSHRDRLRFTNAHLRTISRVVVHPQFRGLGLASELVRQLIVACPTRWVEASAVMARVHPFFTSAGMRRIPFDGAQGGDDERSERNDNDVRPAYFIFDKGEGSPCDATKTK